MNELWQIVKFAAEAVAVLMALTSPFLLAWLRGKIQSELQPTLDTLRNLCDRLAVVEEWRAVAEFQLSQYAPALRDVTRLTTILEQQEEVTKEIRNALVDLNRTLSAFAERLARNEERTKQHHPRSGS